GGGGQPERRAAPAPHAVRGSGGRNAAPPRLCRRRACDASRGGAEPSGRSLAHGRGSVGGGHPGAAVPRRRPPPRTGAGARAHAALHALPPGSRLHPPRWPRWHPRAAARTGLVAAVVRPGAGSRVMSQRIAYVHLPRFPVQRRVLEEPGLAGEPLVLVHETKGALRVAFASGVAQREGIRAGMTLTAARALLPVLRDGPYDAAAETQALSSVAEGLLRFSPAFMLSAPDGLWLDASAASLFGGETGLLERVEAQARAAGYRARVVLASELFT